MWTQKTENIDNLSPSNQSSIPIKGYAYKPTFTSMM